MLLSMSKFNIIQKIYPFVKGVSHDHYLNRNYYLDQIAKNK